MKRPSFQFYPADWRKDPSLSVCSLAARGLWIDMLCIAHESDDYGTLAINGKPMTAQQIARSVGESADTVADLLTELESAGVLSRRDDGAIFCRRMIRDERLRQVRAAAGKLGGNPALLNKKSKQNAPITESEGLDLLNLASKQSTTPSSSASASTSKAKANPLSPSEIAPLGGLSADETTQPTRRKRQPKPKPSVDLTNGELPAWIPLDDWQAFVDHRRQIKKPATRRAQTMLIDELDRLRQRNQSPSAVLRQSVMRGWAGIFEVKGDGNGTNTGQPRESVVDRIARKNGFVRTDDGEFVRPEEVRDRATILDAHDGALRLSLV